MKHTYLAFLAGAATLALVPTAADAQRAPRGETCQVVLGQGDLDVEHFVDDPEEPFVVGGTFQVVIADAADLVAAVVDDALEDLPSYEGTFSLIAFPGSDAPLPGDLSWAPCSSTWTLRRPGQRPVVLESFCESTLVPDVEEGVDIFELFVREEIASVYFPGTRIGCGRLFLDGLWDAEADEAEEVTLSGKLCQCGARQAIIWAPGY